MKNAIKINYIAPGMALMALALCFAVGAFPAGVQAQYNSYSCAHPYVYPNGYYYCPSQASVPAPQPVVIQQQPIYQQPVYQTLSVSCYPVNNSVQVGASVQWVAYVSGGNGSYNYNWTGTDGFVGSGQSTYMTYYNPGVKSASVTVYSGSQSIVAYCSSSVSVSQTYYQQPIYQQPIYQQPIIQQPIQTNNSGLDIGCYADPASARVGQPVTWKVEVTGGAGQYGYSWTGTDALSGNQAAVTKYYYAPGSKSAVVTVTTSDGRSGTQACSGTLTIRSNATAAPVTPVAPVAPVENPDNLGASALFSLSNVPWGWVAVLVILVLFSTVMYLLFNKTKM